MSNSPSQFDLTPQTALVTGGGGAIGSAIVRALIQHGAKVVLGGHTDRAANVAEKMNQDASRPADDPLCVGLKLDVTSSQAVDQAVGVAVDRFGSLDILVNCAGMNMKKATLDVTDDEEHHVMEVNYFGAVRAAKAAARQMIAQGSGGSIVNVCSVTSYTALSEVTAYACSKSALLGLTRQLAVEWIFQGIRTNAIAPGFVPADQNREILKSGDRGRRILENTPIERFGEADEIGGAVVFLCSPAASFVNGECIKIDGGFLINGVSDAMSEH